MMRQRIGRFSEIPHSSSPGTRSIDEAADIAAHYKQEVILETPAGFVALDQRKRARWIQPVPDALIDAAPEREEIPPALFG